MHAQDVECLNIHFSHSACDKIWISTVWEHLSTVWEHLSTVWEHLSTVWEHFLTLENEH